MPITMPFASASGDQTKQIPDKLPHLARKFSPLKIHRRSHPFFWQKIAETSNPIRLRNWQLVLVSQNLPFGIYRSGHKYQIYVPPIPAQLAAWQLNSYNLENSHKTTFQFIWPMAERAWLVLLPLAILAIWHAMRAGALPAPNLLPAPETWLRLGELDNIRIAFHSEYHRAITALSLHMNVSHLAGNVFFGGIFLYILARRIGYGNAFFLATAGGGIGNLLSLFFHRQVWLSAGFSTAVFAAAGASAGLMAIAAAGRRKFVLTAGAALGLLAMLGTEGENTDYAAHCMGLVTGFSAGLAYGWRVRRNLPLLPNLFAFILALLAYAICWGLAFLLSGK